MQLPNHPSWGLLTDDLRFSEEFAFTISFNVAAHQIRHLLIHLHVWQSPEWFGGQRSHLLHLQSTYVFDPVAEVKHIDRIFWLPDLSVHYEPVLLKTSRVFHWNAATQKTWFVTSKQLLLPDQLSRREIHRINHRTLNIVYFWKEQWVTSQHSEISCRMLHVLLLLLSSPCPPSPPPLPYRSSTGGSRSAQGFFL